MKPGANAGKYIFRLYVSGATALSARAVVNARKICDDHLKGRYQLEFWISRITWQWR